MDDILKRLALYEQADQQERVGQHDRHDVTRLLCPGVPSHIIRGSLFDLQDAAKLAGNSYNVQPTIAADGVFVDGVLNVIAYPNNEPGTSINPAFVWADGSVMQSDGTYTWPDSSAGHADPQNPAQTFNTTAAGAYLGLTQCWAGSFAWNFNLFPFFTGNWEIAPGGLPPFNATLNCTLDLLDANSDILKTCSWKSITNLDVTGNDTSTQTMTLDSNNIPAFNAIRATMSATLSSNILWATVAAALNYFLQLPEFI